MPDELPYHDLLMPFLERLPHENLSPLDWLVYHTAQDVARSGGKVTGAAVVAALDGVKAEFVRATLHRLAAEGFPLPEGLAFRAADIRPRPAKRPSVRQVADENRDYNFALLRLVDGRGGIYENLSVLTGQTIDSLKSRVKRARHDYGPEDEAAERPDVLDHDESRYMEAMYGRSKNPEVRAFMAKIHAPTRKRPDCRSSADRPEARGKARRPVIRHA